MFTHRHCVVPLAVVAAASSMATAPALAYDDREFYVAVQEFARAANKDIGLWIDRTTRNDGVTASCNTRIVEFKRFINVRLASVDRSWHEGKAEEWNKRHCGNPIWTEAIRSGWKIELSITATDGRHVSLRARCP